MEPTKIEVQGPATPGSSPAALDTGAIVLSPEQTSRAEQALAELDFATIASGDIVRLGLGAEQALQSTLDGFLARLDRNASARLFELFDRLEQGVDDAKLPEILERLHEGEKPGFIEGLIARITGKTPDQLMREFIDEIGSLIAGRTRTLADQMQRLEGELATEMQKLFAELKALDTLKRSYATHFGEFTVAAGAARAFLDKSRGFVAVEKVQVTPGDVVALMKFQELEDKLRLLESRALALEGTYTRLPADQIVIQQIEQAGVATLQETATTAASRFASIKMTLLAIHAAFAVKSVQQLSERQARMDEQFIKIRSATLKDVAVAAAKAPGDNRMAQAEQIEHIIATTKEVHAMIQVAKRETEEKFAKARQKFVEARRELAQLS